MFSPPISSRKYNNVYDLHSNQIEFFSGMQGGFNN